MQNHVERFPWRYLISGVLVYLALQVMCVGLASFSGSSEAREGQVVDVILREGTWILPLRNGVIPSKPPLYHWSAALISQGLGGVSELSLRLTSQLAAALCLIFVACITFRVSRFTRTFQGASHPARAALVASGVLSLTYGFYQMGCQAMVDMTFTACVWAALTSVVLGIRRAPDTHEYLGVSAVGRGFFWFFSFVGVLARGPLGLLLPVALLGVAAWCVLGWKRAVIELCKPSLGWLAVFIPLGWYMSAFQVGGEEFLERQIFFENIKRFSGGDFVNSEVWWFYAPSLLRTTFPWGVILVLILFKEIRRWRTVSYPEERNCSRWIPAIVLCAGVALFSLSSGKRHSYMLPLLPLVAIQLGVELSSLLERGGARIRQKIVRVGRAIEIGLTASFLLGITGMSVAIASGLVTNRLVVDAFYASAEVASRMGAIILGCALVVFVSVRRQFQSVTCSVWFLMLVVMTTVVAGGAVVKAYSKGFDEMGKTWLATIVDGEELAVFKHRFDEYFDPLLFYVRRPVRLIPLEGVGSECRARTVYAAKRVWLDAHEALFPGSIVRVALVGERLRGKRATKERDLVFFRCSVRAGQAGEEAQLLREASYSESDTQPSTDEF